MQYHPPAQEVMFLSVGDFNTYTAELLMTEGERIVIQSVQPAAKMSVPEEQIKEDYLVELPALRSAGKRTAEVFNLVSTMPLNWRLILKYHTNKVHILRNSTPIS